MKTIFQNDHKQVLLHERLIFTEIWKRIFQNDLKKPDFPRNVDIFGDMGKKLIFQTNLNLLFLLEMLIFLDMRTNHNFF